LGEGVVGSSRGVAFGHGLGFGQGKEGQRASSRRRVKRTSHQRPAAISMPAPTPYSGMKIHDSQPVSGRGTPAVAAIPTRATAVSSTPPSSRDRIAFGIGGTLTGTGHGA